jgi:hypothetical protein
MQSHRQNILLLSWYALTSTTHPMYRLELTHSIPEDQSTRAATYRISMTRSSRMKTTWPSHTMGRSAVRPMRIAGIRQVWWEFGWALGGFRSSATLSSIPRR